MTDGPPTDTGPPGLRRIGTLFGAVIAPTSFVTALLYYFGLHHAYWFYDYFGVNSTVLGLGTTDYLVLSLDALFVPMVVIAVGALLTFWAHDLLRARLATGARPRLLRVLIPAVGSVAFLLALGGCWSVLDSRVFLRDHLAAAPLSLALGVILLSYTLHLRRALPPPDAVRTPAADPPGDRVPIIPDDAGETCAPDITSPPPTPDPSTAPVPVSAVRPEWAAVAEWAAVFLLVGLSLVWAANDYAAAVGWGRAEQFVSGLPGDTTAVVLSEQRLGINAPGVHEYRCAGNPAEGTSTRDAQSAYLYRYEGLVLVIQSANQYVLIPRTWTPATGVAFVIPRTDSVRLEFVPYSARGTLGRANPC